VVKDKAREMMSEWAATEVANCGEIGANYGRLARHVMTKATLASLCSP
jgi:hypothetical protein